MFRGNVSVSSSRFQGPWVILRILEDEGETFLRNADKHLTSHSAAHPRKLESAFNHCGNSKLAYQTSDHLEFVTRWLFHGSLSTSLPSTDVCETWFITALDEWTLSSSTSLLTSNWSQDGVVGLVIRLRTGWFEVQIMARAKGLFRLQSVQTGSQPTQPRGVKRTGAQVCCFWRTQWRYVFRIILKINDDYFFEPH
jgi:hypothetical protein